MVVLKLGTSEGTLEYISYMELKNVEYKVGSVAQWWRARLDGGHKALGSICWTLLHVYACSLAYMHARM